MARQAPRDAAAFELREAMAQPGCPICSLALRSVGRFLSSLAYERVNDLETRAALRARGGFCNVHAYRWLRDAHSVLGTALIYRDVLRAALETLSRASKSDRGPLIGRLKGRRVKIRSVGACPACTAQHEAEERYLSALMAVLGEPGGVEVFDASQGLCLVHAAAAVRRGGPAGQQVVSSARRGIEGLIAALDEVVRKEDYRFRDEARTELERTAPARAVAAACGADGLVVPND